MRFSRSVSVLTAIALLTIAPVLSLPAFASSQVAIAEASSRESSRVPVEWLLMLTALGMAIRVKDIGSIARKFVTRAQAASTDYKEGVQQAGQDWENNALAGKENFAVGVQQAITDGRYEKGIRESGAAKFSNRAATVGATRFGPGVAAAEADYAKGAAPVMQVIAGLTLPPRRPKGDPGNQERANHVARALSAFKRGR